jgi:CubicO group peptidase (beta-lactamase class C family)
LKRAIGSVTESAIAAQVMQMVEAGELDLDDPATDHLPPGPHLDSNGATIRQLLGHAAASQTITLGYWRACQPIGNVCG